MPARKESLVRWLIGMLLLVAVVSCLWQGSASGVVRAATAVREAQAGSQAMPPGGSVVTGATEIAAGSLLLVGLVFSAVALLGLRACGQHGYIHRLRPYRWR